MLKTALSLMTAVAVVSVALSSPAMAGGNSGGSRSATTTSFHVTSGSGGTHQPQPQTRQQTASQKTKGGGKANFEPFSVTRKIDSASTSFFH